MTNVYRTRRIIITQIVFVVFVFIISINTPYTTSGESPVKDNSSDVANEINSALFVLNSLPIKGRAPKSDYSRDQFGLGWKNTLGCDTRNIILNRDLSDVVVDKSCNVISGTLNDPYTGKSIIFKRGSDTSDDVQIDHVVALSDAWQKGAQQLTKEKRVELANDYLELLAVDGLANVQKSDGDAATWLPSNKAFRCQYIARQIAVKQKYNLWVTQAEHDAMAEVLSKCPKQKMPQ